jgi:hypothetical protein
MCIRRASGLILAIFGTGLLPRGAWAGDFIDTRISFTIGDDNFLKKAGQQVPDSPLLGIGERPGYELSFDNLNSATTGRENELHLVLYKKMEGILPGLTTEVAAALEIDLAELQDDDPKVHKVFKDDSSYIRLKFALDKEKRGSEYLDLVLFPLSGDRFRVGYLYDLTWGGQNIFPRRQGRLTPAFKLGGNHGRFYWWAGMKMVRSLTAPAESKDEQGLTITTEERETLYGALAGFGVQPVDGLSIDLSGAFIQMAQNPLKDVAGEMVTATGFSARIAYGRGLKVARSSDLRLLRNDPEFLESLHVKQRYNIGGGLSWSVAAEGTAIAQSLADPSRYATTTTQWASAAAFDVRLMYDYFRVNVTALYRSLEFILLETPSFVPFQAFPGEAQVKPNFFAYVSADYHIPKLNLTPGISAGFEMPSAVKTELTASVSGSNAPPTVIGENTLVIRATGERVILPTDKGVLPIGIAAFYLTWHASDLLTLIGFIHMQYDPNFTTLTVNPDLTKSRVFDDPIRFGAGVTAQARF